MLAILAPFIALFIIVLVLYFSHWWLLARHPHLDSSDKLPRHLVMIALVLVGVIAFVLALPVSDSSRNQIIALLGILISGTLAFSSASLMSNFMAGIVLRINRPFRIGDFVKVDGYTGRVSSMSLLDTEIQTESRELVSFANNYVLTNPVVVVRSSGTIVSVELSLGYDVHHSEVEQVLLRAVERVELADGFVQVTSLGDFAVSYRVAGLLTDVKSLLSARSHLHKAVLDELHNADIEIVSPKFVNSKALDPDQRFLAKRTVPAEQVTEASPEDLVFDKAEHAEQFELAKAALETQLEQIEHAIKNSDGPNKEQLLAQRDSLAQQLEALLQRHKVEVSNL
jgi:small-conductance mechanosensitive channel